MTEIEIGFQGEVLTPEACEILGVDRSTVTRWVKTGRLVPSRKIPGRTGAFLFNRADVEALKAAQAVSA